MFLLRKSQTQGCVGNIPTRLNSFGLFRIWQPGSLVNDSEVIVWI